MTATCEPPEEHRHHEWHWLSQVDIHPRPMQWDMRLGAWLLTGPAWDQIAYPEQMHAGGWRYVGPAVPPQEGA